MAKKKNVMKQWDTLRRIKDLQSYINGLPGVDKTVSFVDYCELLDRGAQSGGGEIMVGPGGEIIAASAPGKSHHLLAGAVSTPRRHATRRPAVRPVFSLSPARILRARISWCAPRSQAHRRFQRWRSILRPTPKSAFRPISRYAPPAISFS